MLTKKLLNTVIAFTVMAMPCSSISKEVKKVFKPTYNYNKEGTKYDFNGEKLEYSLHWLFFHVANAESDVARITKNGTEYLRIQSKVRTAGIVGFFKDIRDMGYSLWDIKLKTPVKTFMSQREGTYVKDKLFSYDLNNMTVTVVKQKPGHEPTTKKYKIPSIPFEDLMTGIYFFRKHGIFKVGAHTDFPVFTGKKFIMTHVKVLKKEKVEVPAGTFETYKCSLSSEVTPKGVFKMKGDVYMWLTTDESHIPVKISGDITIGSVSAELEKFRKGGN
ncbi:DUF3108 domain-containing protein [Desulfurobacterium sp.]